MFWFRNYWLMEVGWSSGGGQWGGFGYGVFCCCRGLLGLDVSLGLT